MCATCRMFWTTTHCQAVFPQPPVVIVTLDGILQGQKCLAPEINVDINYIHRPVLLLLWLLFWFRLKLTHTHKLYTSTSSPVVVLISLPLLLY